MRTIEEMENNVDEILKEVKSGMIDLEKAEVLIDGAQLIIDTYKVQLEHHEFREEKPPDDLPSKKQIEEAESKIVLAKKEIEIRKDEINERVEQ